MGLGHSQSAYYRFPVTIEDELLERVEELDPQTLIRLRGAMEKDLHKTSERIFNPMQVGKGNGSSQTVNVQVPFMSTASESSGRRPVVQHPLTADSRAKVRKLIAGVQANNARLKVVDTEAAEG